MAVPGESRKATAKDNTCPPVIRDGLYERQKPPAERSKKPRSVHRQECLCHARALGQRIRRQKQRQKQKQKQKQKRPPKRRPLQSEFNGGKRPLQSERKGRRWDGGDTAESKGKSCTDRSVCATSKGKSRTDRSVCATSQGTGWMRHG